MTGIRVGVALLLVVLAAPIGGAIYLLGVESVTSGPVGVTTFVLVLVLLLGIGRGMRVRERVSTTYW